MTSPCGVAQRVVETDHLLVGNLHRDTIGPSATRGQAPAVVACPRQMATPTKHAPRRCPRWSTCSAAFGVISGSYGALRAVGSAAMFAKPREVYLQLVTAQQRGAQAVRRRRRARALRRARGGRALRPPQRRAAARRRRAHPVVPDVRRRHARHARRRLGAVGVELRRRRRAFPISSSSLALTGGDGARPGEGGRRAAADGAAARGQRPAAGVGGVLRGGDSVLRRVRDLPADARVCGARSATAQHVRRHRLERTAAPRRPAAARRARPGPASSSRRRSPPNGAYW